MPKEQATLPVATGDRSIEVPIDKPVVRTILMEWLGLAHAVHELESSKLGKGLAGMDVAMLILRQKRDHAHALLLQRTMPLCARAGVDMGAWMIHRFNDDLTMIICKPIADVLGPDHVGGGADG